MVKAVTLISGGLDSILAARLIKELGIDVIPLYFNIPFCHRGKEASSDNSNLAQLVRDNLVKDLKIVDIKEDFLKLLKNPHHGFGSNMNPCIDCKILMLTCAKKIMEDIGAQFVVTGEVLGQRPMSQHRQALEIIARKAGLDGLVLRPLSARLLPETIPETQGWVKRQALLSYSGRGRRPQIDLANNFGIKNFAWPSGGCLLTDPAFSQRLKDLIAHQELTMDNVALLKLGRHFRISDEAKLVVGRNQQEDLDLEKIARLGDYLFYPNENLAGPTALGRGNLNLELIKLCAQITCRYCDLNGKIEAEIIYKKVSQESESIVVLPVQDQFISSKRV